LVYFKVHYIIKTYYHKNDIIIYYPVGNENSGRSRRLACVIANEIQRDNTEYSSIKLYPLSTQMYTENEPERILDGDNIGVLIEIGKNKNLSGDTLLGIQEGISLGLTKLPGRPMAIKLQLITLLNAAKKLGVTIKDADNSSLSSFTGPIQYVPVVRGQTAEAPL
jgi:hypothetical protein